MEIKFELTDKEVDLLAALSGYKQNIEVEVVELDTENDTEEIRLETTPNPVTKEQHVKEAFLAYKDKWIKGAIETQVHKIARETEAKLVDPVKLEAIVETVKDAGIENLPDILKSNL